MSGSSILQGFLLVLMSAINPGALVASAFFLRRERGVQLDNAFLIGGLLASAVVGIVVLELIRLTGLQLPHRTMPRYDLRLGLGILALVLAALLPWFRRRLQRGGAPGEPKPNLVTRLMRDAGIGGAIVVGLVIFAPGPQYLAGLQAISTTEHPIATSVLLVLAAAVVNVAVVWIFLVAYLAAPERTKSHLDTASTWIDWVKSHSDLIIRAILVIVGVYLVISGATGLASS